MLHGVRLCAQGERGGSPRQKNKESGFRKAAQPCGQCGQRAGHKFIVGAGIAVHLYQIDKAGQAQACGRAQQPPIAPFGSGQQRKGKAGQQIALVHTVAEGEYAHGVKCPQQQRAEGVLFQPGQCEQRQCGGEQAKQQNAPLLPAEGAKAAGLRHPVSAKALGQIKGVDHGIGIAGAGGCVFFPKPGQHPAAPERQPGQHHHGGAQGGAGGGGKHGAKPLPGPGAHKGGRKRGGQHRPGQKSLRLNGQCKPIQGGSRHKAIFAQKIKRQCQRQQKKRIDLFPHGGVEQQRRAQQHKACHGQGQPGPVGAAGNPKGQRRKPTGTQRRGQSQQHPGHGGFVANVQKLHQLADAPQNIQVARRVIAKISGAVKPGRAKIGHAQGPG